MMSSVGLVATAPARPARVTLAASRAYCRDLTRRAARNFYYGLRLLPEPKRSSMYALYAYMRLLDDIADAEDGRPVERRLDDLAAWQEQTHAACAGRVPDAVHPIWPAFVEMAARHDVPRYCFDDAIAGQRQDLQPRPFESFDQLSEYCRQVAGVVGVASIYIWGFQGGRETERLALDRGLAFQLTNILRDLREDAALGRTYLPQCELTGCDLPAQFDRRAEVSKPFADLMEFQIDRARSYYVSSADLERRIAADSRPTLVAMTCIYRSLLERISADPARVLRERVRLSLFAKLRIGWRAARSNRA
jgi:phytoene synthase